MTKGPGQCVADSVWQENASSNGHKKAPEKAWGLLLYGGDDRIRTGDKGFAGLCLTTWPRRH